MFCVKCGNENDYNNMFCVFCGEKLIIPNEIFDKDENKNFQENTIKQERCTVNISRVKGKNFTDKPIEILIDDNYKYVINEGENIVLELIPGDYEFNFRVDPWNTGGYYESKISLQLVNEICLKIIIITNSKRISSDNWINITVNEGDEVYDIKNAQNNNVAKEIVVKESIVNMSADEMRLKLEIERLMIEKEQLELQREQFNGMAKCPRCGSTSLSGNKKGFGVGKAVVGAWAIGPLGLMAGNISAKKVHVTCLKCGKRFLP